MTSALLPPVEVPPPDVPPVEVPALDAGDLVVPVLAQRDAGDPDVIAEQAARLGIAGLALRLLRARGVVEDDAIGRAVAPKLRDLRAPEQMAGFPAALELLAWAGRRRLRVGVFGDYDVDGVCTAAILAGYLEAIGLQVVTRVAHRDAGYGLAETDADAFAAAGVQLVLVGDTGTSDIAALERIRARGMRSVVIDHHQVPSEVPPCDALINPHQESCGFPFKGLCSAGVAFYLCASLRTQLVARGERAPDPKGWLDLVAIATVCDMMPLVEENRVLVHRGLALLRTAPRPGVRAMLERAGAWNENPIDETTIGFKIGPRINAPGRLGAADPSLRLLRARTAAEAGPLAEQIEGLNNHRRTLSQRAVEEAAMRVAADPVHETRAAICVADGAWPPGVVGLVAGALAERFRRPAMVLSIESDTQLARGSVRSYGGVDVRAALQVCEPLLERFGGHREAAGLTVREDRIEAVAQAFSDACRLGASAPAAPRDEVDGRLPLAAIDVGLGRQIGALAPFGVGFVPPRFAVQGRVESVRILKERHAALRLGEGGVTIEGIAFGQIGPGLWTPAVGDALEAVCVPMLDVYRGQTRVRLQIERFWPASGAARDLVVLGA